MSAFSINGQSQFADLNFEFNKDPFYDSENIEYDETFNIRNQTFYNGTYPATFSFTEESIKNYTNGMENDAVDEINFIDEAQFHTGCGVSIENEIDGHKKILTLWEDSTTTGTSGINSILSSSQIIGDFEAWFRWDSNQIIFQAFDSEDNEQFQISADSNGWDIEHGGGYDLNNGKIKYNQWYHIRVNFNQSLPEFSLYINTSLIDTWETKNSNDISYIRISTGWQDEMKFNIDAIAYSWDSVNAQTYSFEEFNVNDEFNPLINPYGNWTYGQEGDSMATIQDDFPISNKYLQILDGSDIDKYVVLREDFFNVKRYFLEFYFYGVDLAVNERINLEIKDDEDHNIFTLYFEDTDIKQGNGTILATYVQGYWNLLRIKLDCFTDRTIIYINGTQIYNYDMPFDVNLADYFEISSLITEEAYKFLIDEVRSGTWIPTDYTIGLNRYPLLETTNFQEVNRYEFALEGIDNPYDVGDNNPSGWTDIENNNGITLIQLDFVSGDSDVNDRMVQMGIQGSQDRAGIQKLDFNLTEKFIGIEIGFGLVLNNREGSMLYFNFTTESTLISQLIFNYTDTSLSYNNGTIHELRSDLVLAEYYEIKLLLNYEWGLVFMDYYIDYVFDESYEFGLIESNKSGLEEISIELIYNTGLGGQIIGIDYIGVYADGLSQSSEYGWTTIDLNKATWSPEEHNLLEKIANGYIHFGVSEGQYYVGVSWTALTSIRQYTGTLTRDNVYDGGGNKSNPQIILTVKDTFNITSLIIEGIRLNQGTNEYIPELTNGGILNNESYFYVDSSHNLKFVHIADDSGKEFIQASFDIVDRSSNSSTIGWKSRRDNNAYGYFRISYEGDSSVYEIAPFVNTYKILLAQERVIDKLVMLVSDGGFSRSGETTGYFTSVSIQYSADVITTVVTLNLVSMLIPLIMILVPTLAISERYGRNLIIPLFIFFSVILVAVGTIPLWLFFVIALSSSMFLLTRRESGDVI